MKIQYRRKLPHKFFPGYTFFITWNLKDAIPHKILAPMIRERDLLLDQLELSTNLSPDEKAAAIYDIKQKFFITYNQCLDNVHPESPMWLKVPEVAQTLVNRLHELDNKYYKLIA